MMIILERFQAFDKAMAAGDSLITQHFCNFHLDVLENNQSSLFHERVRAYLQMMINFELLSEEEIA